MTNVYLMTLGVITVGLTNAAQTLKKKNEHLL